MGEVELANRLSLLTTALTPDFGDRCRAFREACRCCGLKVDGPGAAGRTAADDTPIQRCVDRIFYEHHWERFAALADQE